MVVSKNSMEKVTFNIPSDLKQEVLKLKEEMKVSLNTIYKNAIADYIKKQELKKWEDAVKKASQNKEYTQELKEMTDSGVELYE